MIDEIYIELENEEEEDKDKSPVEQCTSARTVSPEKSAPLNNFVMEHSAAVQDSIISVRDSIPILRGAFMNEIEILKKAYSYIQFLTKQNREHVVDNAAIRRGNAEMEQEIARLTERWAMEDAGDSHEGEENNDNSNHNSSINPENESIEIIDTSENN